MIIGGGQAGLAMAYYLKKENIPFVILDKNEQVGDSWRRRYDSLVLFTPRTYSSLPELEMEGLSEEFPTKDEVADYLDSYVKHFEFPIIFNTNVVKLSKQSDGSFLLETTLGQINAKQIVVATGAFQKPFIPNIVKKKSSIFQLHSSDYQSPRQLKGTDVLVVGGGNSGAQIAVELAKYYKVTIAVGHKFKFLPLKLQGKSIFKWLEIMGLLYAGKDSLKGKWFQRQSDPIFGRELKKLIRNRKVVVKPKVTCVNDTEVHFTDNTRSKFTSIIWSTGFVPSYEWINLEGVISNEGKPIHTRGITNIKGLYFLGLPWQHQRGSALLCGVSLDAKYLVPTIISNVSKSK